MMSECETCLGTGEVNGPTCPDCDGAGYFDTDGEPIDPNIDALIAAAVMPIPTLANDPTWAILHTALGRTPGGQP